MAKKATNKEESRQRNALRRSDTLKHRTGKMLERDLQARHDRGKTPEEPEPEYCMDCGAKLSGNEGYLCNSCEQAMYQSCTGQVMAITKVKMTPGEQEIIAACSNYKYQEMSCPQELRDRFEKSESELYRQMIVCNRNVWIY